MGLVRLLLNVDSVRVLGRRRVVSSLEASALVGGKFTLLNVKDGDVRGFGGDFVVHEQSFGVAIGGVGEVASAVAARGLFVGGRFVLHLERNLAVMVFLLLVDWL